MIMAAEASLYGGGGCKDIDYLLMIPEQTVFGVGCFGKQRKVADDDYLFSSALQVNTGVLV